MAISVLDELKNKYPNIKYSVVLAYIPGKKQENDLDFYYNSIVPD